MQLAAVQRLFDCLMEHHSIAANPVSTKALVFAAVAAADAPPPGGFEGAGPVLTCKPTQQAIVRRLLAAAYKQGPAQAGVVLQQRCLTQRFTGGLAARVLL